MADTSKADLKKEIQAILKDADLDNTSAKKVRLELQEKLDCDLTERKKEVDQLVMEVIDEQTQEDDDEEEEKSEEEQSEEEEEEVVKKPVKRPTPKPAKAENSDDESGEEGPPSDGGGSDYEPDDAPAAKKATPKRAGAKPKKRKGGGSDSDGSSGEEWGGAAKKKKKAAAPKRKKKNDSGDDSDEDFKPKKKKKAGGTGKANGWTAPIKLSEQLAEVVGGDEMPRHEVVKRMWAYIKENKLQDPKNKQFIVCDEKLSNVFPTKKFRGFGMTKFLKEHMNVDKIKD